MLLPSWLSEKEYLGWEAGKGGDQKASEINLKVAGKSGEIVHVCVWVGW